MKKSIAALAMTCTALSSMMSTPAMAVGPYDFEPTDPTPTLMDTACSNHLTGAVSNSTATNHDGSQVWSVETVYTPGDKTTGAAQEVAGSKVEIPGTRFGTGSFSLSGISLLPGTIPFRNGGSVNMFGNRYATSKDWTNSTFQYNYDASIKTTFNFSCVITENHETVTPGEVHPGLPGGQYINHGGQVCRGITPDNPNWGEDEVSDNSGGENNGQSCHFVSDGTTLPGTTDPDDYDYNDVAHPELTASKTQDQTDFDYGLEGTDTNGGPWSDTTHTFYDSTVVICISPSTSTKRTVAGWATQNGYTGSLCTTAHFLTDPRDPLNMSSTTSRGTYISVPGYPQT